MMAGEERGSRGRETREAAKQCVTVILPER